MTEPVPDGWLLRFLRRGALKHLSVALHDSKGALSWEWVARDPDLREVRSDDDPDWALLFERYGGTSEKPTDPQWDAVRKHADRLVDEMGKLRGQPDRPWGDPARRHYAWSAVAILLALAVVVLILAGVSKPAGVLVALAVLASLATIRAAVLGRETWGSWRAALESRGDPGAWRRRSMGWRWVAFVLGVFALIYVGLEVHGIEWLLPLAVALIVALALVWAVIASNHAAWLEHVANP